MTTFERKLPSESIDEAEILRGILSLQAAYAAEQHRPPGRGTHTKGICAQATFEIYDLEHSFGDPALAARLAHGIFARPGVYNATVRFANAASTIYRDKKFDLRALSFSVQLQPGMAGGAGYQDFSVQSASTFPINDLHTFAVTTKVLSAGGAFHQLKAILLLPPLDMFRFAKTSVLGELQKIRTVGAYQHIRYWSTVPFSHGPAEAVKFSAIPDPENPACAFDGKANELQDELIRHLNEDERMSSFDFAVQLLEPARMTRWGMRRAPSFWIENATVEWNEKQAPFYKVGRLTLLPKSVLRREECEPKYIDVTEHSTPDTKPLGSVNRGRYAVELASRKVRLGEATAESILAGLPKAVPVRHPVLRGLGNIFALLVLLVLLLSPPVHFLARHIYAYLAAKNIPAAQYADHVVYLDQGWSAEARETFYYTPQGTSMDGVRYSWFVNLEQPFVRARLADPEHMRSLNFVVDPPSQANPDQLPVGFAKRYDDALRDNVADITCAACHTRELNFTRNGKATGIRIDGAGTLTAFSDVNSGSFETDLGLSLIETLLNPLKFHRFASNVLGSGSWNLLDRFALWRSLASVTGAVLKAFLGSSSPTHYPVQEGYGRSDALGRIGNVMLGDHISSKNYHPGNGPVRFPYLWNIWKFNWLQYNASMSQAMARNVGETLGVGATLKFLDDRGRPLPESERYKTTTSFDNIYRLETTLQQLKPPPWPEDVLGKIDQASAARGQQLFQAYCYSCHGPHVASQAIKTFISPGRTAGEPLWVIEPVNVNVVGTDPATANNFVHNTADLTPAGITLDEVKPIMMAEYKQEQARQAALIPALEKEIALCKSAGGDTATLNEMEYELNTVQGNQLTDQAIEQKIDSIDLHAMNVGAGLSLLDRLIRNHYYAEHNISAAQQAVYAGFDTLDTPQAVDAYKPRPLEGAWAAPPYLHNGSVPNLYELLSPASERSTRFFVGRREFDPVKVGLATQPAEGTTSGFWFDTTIAGNRNTGHEFSAAYQPNGKSPAGAIGPALSPSQRMDLIEYLKLHRDDPDSQAKTPAACSAP
jgi:hypothetical protein